MEFEKEWCELGDHRMLYVRPKRAVINEDWMAFFDTELDGYQDDLFLILINDVGVDDNIDHELFYYVAESLKNCNVQRARFAVLTDIKYTSMLKKLFEDLATAKGLDLKVQLFEERDTAEAWLGNQQASSRCR